jgi:hypothetical protein
MIDARAGLTLWVPEGLSIHDGVARLWDEIASGGAIDETDALTTPKLYGSKLRLTDVLYAVSAATLPFGAPMLDLMAGTGIVTRKFAARHPVSANDANPFAALLTRAQAVVLGIEEVSDVLRQIKTVAENNLEGLRRLISGALDQEEAFLHAEYDGSTLAAYSAFCAQPILPPRPAPPCNSPHSLCVERYANAYFGVAQAAEIDSLRTAIERVLPEQGPARDLCLAALLVAVCTINSGPHFAQPRKVSSVRALREVAERRARSVLWEFELTLHRLAVRRAPPMPIGPVTSLDWRQALDGFAPEAYPAAVYLDPPYTKFQYSRYYHVLNVLIAYDYPPCEGIGRYPPRSHRFSSHFEYRPQAAKRELVEVIQRSAAANLHLILNYSDRGFISIEALRQVMCTHFRRVHEFSEQVRHHSQGVKLSTSHGKVTEFVLVGEP